MSNIIDAKDLFIRTDKLKLTKAVEEIFDNQIKIRDLVGYELQASILYVTEVVLELLNKKEFVKEIKEAEHNEDWNAYE